MSAPPSFQSQSREERPRSQHGLFPDQRAASPKAPELTPAVRQAVEERAAYQVQREIAERHSVLRGLIFLALLVLVISLVRAGANRAFFTGWWRQW